MNKVIEIQPDYQASSAFDALAQLELATRLTGGKAEKAIEYLEKGVKLSPNNTTMRFHLAEAYVEANRDGEAKKQIETIMSTTPDAKYMAEHKDAMAKAEKLLKKIG